MVPGIIERSAEGAIEVKGELRSPRATIRLVRYTFARPPHSALPGGDEFRLELCLTSRHLNTRGCFRNRWNWHRYERIGDVFLVPPGVELIGRSDEATPLTSLLCELNRTAVTDLLQPLPELTDRHLVACLDIRNARIRNLLLRLAEEVSQPGFASETLADLIAGEIAIEMARLGAELSRHEPQGGLASWRLRLIDERLKDISPSPTLEELAGLCNLSVRQLTRAFRASWGCSIGAYVANKQLEHARRLLGTDKSVAAIAGSLGFSSSSNFCAAFRKATGMAPGQFRRAMLCH
jgi:AraC family transcriptional regulator